VNTKTNDYKKIEKITTIATAAENSKVYITMMTLQARKLYYLKKIDLIEYERQINVLTVLQLQLAKMNETAKEVAVDLIGGSIDATA
jgi:hypothetical protein